MKCSDPKLCYTAKSGRRYLRHFSKASLIIKKMHQEVFDCGSCFHCRKKNAREIAMKCVLESSLYDESCFVTCTYDEKRPGYHNRYQREDIQKFKKSLRRHVEYRNPGRRIKVFDVHEYGKNKKKHWHLIVMGFDFKDKKLFKTKNGNRLYTSKALEKIWKHGFSTIGDVTEASAMYQAQYTQKDVKNKSKGEYKSKSVHSGLGRDYFLKNFRQLMLLGYVPFNNRKEPFPRYFEKIAERHYCYFYDQSAFHDLVDRKAKFRPFKKDEPIRELADLWPLYKERKKQFIEEIAKQWKEVMDQHIKSQEEPDFVKSGVNSLYDLENKVEKYYF